VLARRALEINGRLLAGMVNRVARRLGFHDALLWNFSPLHGTAVHRVARALTVYDVCDEWRNYVPSASGRQLLDWIEDRLCREADLVFVGMENGKALRQDLNPEVHVVHHAADYDHFAQAAQDDTPFPDDLAGLPHPMIGSVGVLDSARFDVDLIRHIAGTRPKWSIVLVGPPRADMDLTPLQRIPNVYLLGNRPISELPNYLKAFDVAIIPYKVNEATRNIYPLKLQEYLATGTPVVTAALPAMLPYREVVEIADSREDFVAKIERCLFRDSRELAEARQGVARQNSWEHRVEEKSEHILRVLGRNGVAE
jgi:glycosyltransferase involved in cell wall biosynthesis